MNQQRHIFRPILFRSAAVLVLCTMPLLGGCQQELFTGRDQNIQGKSQYFPDPHPIDQSQSEDGVGGGAMPYGGQNGF
ncbi:MAG: hypothetical protein M1472_00320 [Planctomycetes bacterium]|nr:hypothetical protein [Planctomycetota bacterium]MDA8377280.1 hypothetical protein [Planctomycetia bacterium]